MEKNKHKLSSSALAYAITFMLLIGLICSGVLFISSINKRIESVYLTKERLIFDHFFSLRFASKNDLKPNYQLIHPSGDTSSITSTNWGAYKMIFIKTFHQNQSQQKSALVGFENSVKLPALYIVNNDLSLKIGGDTKLEGDVFLPENGIERSYVSGKNYKHNELLYFGTINKSKKELPKLKDNYSNLNYKTFLAQAERKDFNLKDSSFSFQNQTTLFTSLTPILLSNNLKGNVIIHSFDSIFVSSKAQLEHVILIAPIIRFEKGFEGAVQAIASERITCEEDVFLSYPSTLVLNEMKLEQSKLKKSCIIEIFEKSSILGGILITSQNLDYRNYPKLIIQKEAMVAGLIYNIGETELYGKVVGNLYTDHFLSRIGGGIYVNQLIDVSISSTALPKNFLLPDWLYQNLHKTGKLIACF